MNNDNGELTKKAEMLEIEFLREMGVDTLGKYPEIEKHINKLTDVLIGENDDLSEISESDFEDIEQDLEDKRNAIDSASCTLARMKEKLLSYIEDMESCLQ